MILQMHPRMQQVLVSDFESLTNSQLIVHLQGAGQLTSVDGMLSTCRGDCRLLAAINRPAEVLPSHQSSAGPAFPAKRPVAR